MTTDLLKQIARQQGVDPIQLVLDYIRNLQEPPENYASFEMDHIEDNPSDFDDDTVVKYYVDGYPADETKFGSVVVTVALTRRGDIVVDWHHNGYRMNESVLELVNRAKAELKQIRDNPAEEDEPEHGPDEQPYVVSLAINGRYYAHVFAKDPKEAENKANDACSDADFGELETIDWTTDHVEDPDGNFI